MPLLDGQLSDGLNFIIEFFKFFQKGIMGGMLKPYQFLFRCPDSPEVLLGQSNRGVVIMSAEEEIKWNPYIGDLP